MTVKETVEAIKEDLEHVQRLQDEAEILINMAQQAGQSVSEEIATHKQNKIDLDRWKRSVDATLEQLNGQ